MDQSTKYQQVIAVLKEKGYSDSQIVEFTQDLTSTSFSKLYSEAMLSFTDEDFKAIEKCIDQRQANEEIRKRYKLRTNKDPDQEALKFFDNFAEGFLQEYQKEQAVKPS
ncbi:hypothetical protein HYS91_00640 [Candidatus Daviesbacteria bacterium]|nr:hypothetical protein [Candidatus Daviesbacteria bacterium]